MTTQFSDLQSRSASPTAQQVVFLFDNLPDWQQLAAGVRPGVQLVVLDGSQDGLAQIAAALQGRQGLDAIHILSHGQPGSVQLGTLALDSAALAARADTLAQIGSALGDNGDILLYGCDVADGEAGGAFIAQWATLTQADVTASSDRTGAASLGGDWVLEAAVGPVESSLALSATAMDAYGHALAIADADFDNPQLPPVDFVGPYFLNGVMYRTMTPGAGHGKGSIPLEPTNFSITQPDYLKPHYYDLGLFFNMDETGGFAPGPVDARISSADGSEFRIASMEVDTGTNLGTSPNLTITGYRDGNEVASDTIITSTSDNEGSVTYSNNNILFDSRGGTLTFNSDWDNIDEIRFTGSDTIVAIDALDFEAAILPPPTITSATYDASTGVLVVTGSNFAATDGAGNDVVANKLTFTAEGGATYTLTDTANVEISSASSFTLTLSASDRAALDLIANKDSTSSTGGTTYNLAGAAGFVAAHAATADVSGNGITVSNVGVPTITSATYDASTGVLVVTGTGLKTLDGAANDIDATKFTLQGEGGSSYTLTATGDVDVTNGSSFTLTLDASDKAAVDLLLNKNGSSAIDATGYHLAAAEDWARGADAAAVVADTTGNGIVVSGVVDPAPAVSSIARGGPNSTNASNLTYLVTFSEAVTGVDVSDFTLTTTGSAGATIASLAGSGSQYAVTLIGVSGAGTLRLDLIDSGTGISDSIGTPAPGYTAGEVYTIDTVSPEVVSVAVPHDGAYGAGQHLDFRVNFSEAVTIDTSGGTPRIAVTLATGGTVYADYLSTDGSELTFRVVVAAGWQDANGISLGSALELNGATLRDAAGNNALLTLNNVATTSGVLVDAIAPEAPVSLALHAASDSGVSNSDRLTAHTTPTITGQAEAYSTVTLYDSDGQTILGTDEADASGFWSITSVPLSQGSHMLSARATDAAGNPGPASAPLVLTIDATAPTLTITTSAAVLASGQTATITFTFSEDPGASFTWDGSIGDVMVSGGTLGAISGVGLTRSALFTPTPATNAGTASITVTAGAYADTAGNGGLAGGPLTLNFDTLAPTTTIASFAFSADTGASGLDFVTRTAQQTISGTLSAPLAAGERVQVSLDAGDTWLEADASAGSATWSLADQTLVASNTLQARVLDAAGNAGPAASQAYVLDTTAPSAAVADPADDATGVSVSNAIVLGFSEPLDAASSDLTKVYLRDVATGALVAATITLNANGELLIQPAANLGYSTAYYVTWDDGALQDLAGNAATAVSDKTTYNFTTLAAPPSPPAPPVPAPVSVDGVPVFTSLGADGATLTTVAVVAPGRADTPGTPSALADIPLVTGAAGQPLLIASLPVGTGLQADGFSSLLSVSQALQALIARITALGDGNADLLQAARDFHAGLLPGQPLALQLVKPTAGAGFDPGNALSISGSDAASDGRQAIIIDGSGLPGGSTLQLNNVDFAAVIGNVRLVGGAGQNVVYGDGAQQYIVLGADDDILHGGGGNDTVGSKGGNDQIHGDAGNDIVFGGAGNDQLWGGSGSDRLNGGTGFDVAIQEGKRSDYTVTLDGAGIKLTHVDSGVSDWLVDVEQVRFATGPSLTVAHSEAEETAAFLFRQWMGREPTPSEGAAIQTLDGLSAQQVAELFAQVFPQQAGGRTAQQLLEGMDSADAIRVDAARTTTFTGDAGDNSFTPTPGLAWTVDGGAGIDTLVFPATLAQLHVQASDKGYTLQRMTDGAMLELANVERVTLEDTKLALDLDGHAGEAAKLIGAVAGAAFLDNKPLVGEVMRALDAGVSAQGLAQLGLQLLGASTPGQVTQLLWSNVVGSAATPAQLQPFVAMMAQGVTGGELAVLASHLELNAMRIDLVGLSATGIEFA